jgi:hypothetical protein
MYGCEVAAALETVVRLEAFEGAGAGLGEGHAPEVGILRDELNADIFFAVAMTASGDDAALHGLAGVLVHEDEGLIENDFLIEDHEAAVLADGVSGSVDGELFAGEGFAVDAQGHGHGDSGGTAFFSTSITRDGHEGVLCLPRAGELLVDLVGRLFHAAAEEHREICVGKTGRLEREWWDWGVGEQMQSR